MRVATNRNPPNGRCKADDGAGCSSSRQEFFTAGVARRRTRCTPASEQIGVNLTSEEFLAKLASLPLAYQPGTVWDYSLATTSALPLKRAPQAARQGAAGRIWDPLGMTDTGFNIPVTNRTATRAGSPTSETGKHSSCRPETAQDGMGGGCGSSTAGDYVRFAQMLLGKGTLGTTRILAKKTVEYMTTDHLGPEINNRIAAVSPMLNGYGFGLGFAVRRGDGVSSMSGSGGEYLWSGAYGTYFWVDPKEQLVVVLMSHTPGVYRATLRPMVGALVYQAINL
jgi:CubicO group peptidase (beta-lactamase class C family)